MPETPWHTGGGVATIRKRANSKGEARFEAIIRFKRDGKTLHRESRTFSRLALAKDWAKARELELERPGAIENLRQPAPELRLGKLLARYVKEFETLGAWGRSKGAALKALQEMPIADKDASTLNAAALVDHVRSRRLNGTGPSTAGQDLTWIGVVLKAAKGAWGLPVNPLIVVEARETARALRLTAKGRRRERRPTADELTALEGRWARRTPHMIDVARFAIASARRQDEIVRLLWSDLDEASHSILVRDVKHPQGAQGNHRRAKLTAEALAIINRQPKTGERIFPYTSDAVSASFTRACKVLGIADLHFHDLRHEATSRLFEAGYSIPEVAMFTLHESWAELKRYANLRPETMALR